jgi:hypothetical protein
VHPRCCVQMTPCVVLFVFLPFVFCSVFPLDSKSPILTASFYEDASSTASPKISSVTFLSMYRLISSTLPSPDSPTISSTKVIVAQPTTYYPSISLSSSSLSLSSPPVVLSDNRTTGSFYIWKSDLASASNLTASSQWRPAVFHPLMSLLGALAVITCKNFSEKAEKVLQDNHVNFWSEVPVVVTTYDACDQILEWQEKGKLV